MKRGGRVIYGGKLGERSNIMIDYFQVISLSCLYFIWNSMSIGLDLHALLPINRDFLGFPEFLMVTTLQLGCSKLVLRLLKRELVKTLPWFIRILSSIGNCYCFWTTTASRISYRGSVFCEYLTVYKYRDVEASIEQASVPPIGSEPLRFSSTFSQDSFSQFHTCFWKQNLVYWRSPQYSAVRLLFTTASALIIGSIFWDIGSKR